MSEDIKFDISCKITIQQSFEPVATWVEDNMNRIFCIGQFMSRFKDILEECGINISDVIYDLNHMDCIDYDINDKMFIRITTQDCSILPKDNSLYVLLLERFGSDSDLRTFIHSYYNIEFRKDEYIRCINEWHRSSNNGMPSSPEEYKSIDEKLHVAVDRQIADIDKEIQIKNTRKSSLVEWKRET